jgi:hypothetical protein
VIGDQRVDDGSRAGREKEKECRARHQVTRGPGQAPA